MRTPSLVALSLLVLVAPASTMYTADASPATCLGQTPTIVGSDGQVTGTDRPDVIIVGGSSNIDSLGGDDLICIQGGASRVDAGAGDDVVSSEDLAAGWDTLVMLGPGADRFRGGGAQDEVYAAQPNDRFRILSGGTATALVVTMATMSVASSGSTVGKPLAGTLVLASSSGAPGIPVSLHGSIPTDQRTRVKLQRLEDSGFVTVAEAKTDRGGRFVFITHVPDDRATASYRVSSAKMVTPTRTVVTGTTTRLTQDPDQTKEPVSRIGATTGAISADGQHVAYVSRGAVFVWDRATGLTARVTADDAPWSTSPSISDDGRYVAYSRNSASHGRPEVAVWNRTTGVTTQVTPGHTSTSPPSISGNGRFVVYSSRLSDLVPHDTNWRSDVFVWDRSSGSTRRITGGNEDSYIAYEAFSGAISDAGRYITYRSYASDLVPGDKNGAADLFVWDRRTGDTRRLPAGDDSSGEAVISGNGRYIAYTSKSGSVAHPLRYLDVFVWDQVTGRTVQLSDDNRSSISPSISTNGRSVVFASHSPTLVPGDTNGEWADVFMWDRRTGTTIMVSDSSLNARVPAVSGDGRHVVYEYGELDGINGPPDIYLWDLGS